MTRWVRVWDPVVRVGHWLLVAGIVAAWITRHSPSSWHERLGYLVLGVVALRIAWGWMGSPYARFVSFVSSPASTLRYARQMITRNEPRHLGHNPLGGWMIIALLITITAVCLTGWLYTTDRFWGVEWVETTHSMLTDLLLILVGLHICGVLYSTYRHRENLVASMLHGRKRESD